MEHTTFSFGLEWNTITILEQAGKFLEKHQWEISNSMGFADTGESAFILEATKGKLAFYMQLDNEGHLIVIKGGIAGKYLPKGKQVPKYSERFTADQVLQAGQYFEKIVTEMA